MLPAELASLIAKVAGADAERRIAKAFMERSRRHYGLIEQRLGKTPYIAGNEFTAADINLVFAPTTMRTFVPKDISPYPNILAYLQRIGARPAYRRAIAAGDPALTPVLQ